MALDIDQMDAVGTLSAMRDGTLSPQALAEATAQRASDQNALNALIHFDPDYLFRMAKETADANGPLGGLPIVAKDNINTVCYPTSAGTASLMDHTPAQDAAVVEAIHRAGGFIGAKAGMHELAFGITSNNAVTGPVRNPVNPDLIPGGSSGGTAAAIAGGIFALGLGTDTGGSCRIPASLCGIVGFRPTTGRYSAQGVIPISHTRDTVGPMARSVRDIILMDRVLFNRDYSCPKRNLSEVKIGIPNAVLFDDLDPHTAQVIEENLSRLAKAGVTLVDVDLGPIFDHNAAFSFPVVLYEVMRDLPLYLRENAPQISFDALIKAVKSPDVAGVLNSQLGDDAMPQAAYDAALNEHRPAMRSLYATAFDTHGLDGIAFPTTPLPAQPIGADETVVLNGQDAPTFPTFIRNTDLGSNLAAPGISLPCQTGDALPVGLEIDGLPGSDEALLSLAQSVFDTITQ